jgi:hypothetical protein
MQNFLNFQKKERGQFLAPAFRSAGDFSGALSGQFRVVLALVSHSITWPDNFGADKLLVLPADPGTELSRVAASGIISAAQANQPQPTEP